MSGHLLVYGLIVAVLLAPAAWLAERAMALGRWPRRWVWVAALSMTLALPLLAPLRVVPVVAGLPGGIAQWAMVGLGSGAEQTVGATAWLRRIVETVEPWLGPLWLASSAAVAAGLLAGAARLARQRRGWRRRAIGGDVLFVSTRTGPAVVGLFSPQIVVPAWVLDLDAQALEVVLRHERQHIASGDVWIACGSAAALVLMPWNPVVWWMIVRLRLAVEIDCDARVLAAAVATPNAVAQYGQTLIDLARRKSGGGLVLMPAMIQAPSALSRRIAAMCDDRVAFRRTKSLAAGLGALMFLLGACGAPAPDSALGPSRSSEATATSSPRPTAEVIPDAPVQSGPATTGTTPSTTGPDGAREVAPEPAQAEIARLGPGVTNPRVLRQVRPFYTPDAMRRKVQGVVEIEALVGRDGRVEEVGLLKSLDPDLDAEAMKAARQWEFAPATVDGKPVAVMVVLQLTFTIH